MLKDKYVVVQTATIRETLNIIQDNHDGYAFVTDDEGVVKGVVTDGDVRRALLSGLQLNQSVSSCMNKEFVYADMDTPRERIIKRLDKRIKALPLLDSQGKLINIITRSNIPNSEQKALYARSRAPVRMSFSGGGSDLTYFFSEQRGAVLNATISMFCHCTMRLRADRNIIVVSRDLNARFECDDISKLDGINSEFDLIAAVIKAAAPEYGFELHVHSDFPMKSGLGGSSAVAVAILGCFNEFRTDTWTRYEISTLAYQAERIYLGIEGGWQDQYATTFGGFNYIEFKLNENVVFPIRFTQEHINELEESLILCYVGGEHDSGQIHQQQRTSADSSRVRQAIGESVELCQKMRDQLLTGRLYEFGKCMHKGWVMKRKMDKSISNERINFLYQLCIDAGAIGGKLLGAGGGGFLLFFVTPNARFKVLDVIENQEVRVMPFSFEKNGLQTWKCREFQEQSNEYR